MSSASQKSRDSCWIFIIEFHVHLRWRTMKSLRIFIFNVKRLSITKLLECNIADGLTNTSSCQVANKLLVGKSMIVKLNLLSKQPTLTPTLVPSIGRFFLSLCVIRFTILFCNYIYILVSWSTTWGECRNSSSVQRRIACWTKPRGHYWH